MMILMLLIVLSLYGLLNYYVLNKLIKAIKLVVKSKKIIIFKIIGVLLAITMVVPFALGSRNIGVVGTIGNYWMGFMLVGAFIFGISDLIMFIVRKVKKTPKKFNKKALLIDISLVCVIFAYGVIHSNTIHVEDYSIVVNKKSSLDKLNVVMFSDLHLGYVNGDKRLEKVVNKINEQNPDIVIIAGDLYDGNFEAVKNKEKVEKLFSNIKSKYGTYMAWGNHDAGVNFEKMKGSVQRTNITLLEDEVKIVEDTVAIVGRKDSRPIGDQGTQRGDIHQKISTIKEELPIIVIDHRPSNIHEYKENIDLILSGHTHKGQVFPANLITNSMFTVDYGHYKSSTGTQTIVSSGAGTWGPPMRIGTNSEIVNIDITFKK